MTEQQKNADWYEREYNPRVLVPHVGEIVADWVKRANETRQSLSFEADIAYGPHPRELLDLYRAPNARGTVLFIHGGNWIKFTKFETSWIARSFVDRGLSVALLNYPVCPEARLPEIIDSTRRAFLHLTQQCLEGDERRIVVTGHSAGGYLAALHLATDWSSLGLLNPGILGVVSLSGLYDLSPMPFTASNADVQLTEQQAKDLSLTRQMAHVDAPLVRFVGGDESDEFKRQSDLIGGVWPSLCQTPVDAVSGCNHFTIVDELRPDGVATQAVLRLFDK